MLRAVYHDDKNGNITVFLDYLVPQDNKSSLTPKEFNKILKDGMPRDFDDLSIGCGTPIYWDIKLDYIDELDDDFSLNHQKYYAKHLRDFEYGIARDKTIASFENTDWNYMPF